MKTSILIMLITIFIVITIIISLRSLSTKAIEHVLIKRDADKSWSAIYAFFYDFRAFYTWLLVIKIGKHMFQVIEAEYNVKEDYLDSIIDKRFKYVMIIWHMQDNHRERKLYKVGKNGYIDSRIVINTYLEPLLKF